jgi:hypothetical protein
MKKVELRRGYVIYKETTLSIQLADKYKPLTTGGQDPGPVRKRQIMAKVCQGNQDI